MRALVCTVPGRLDLVDRPEPGDPPPGWVLLAVSHVGICGTDYHIYESSHPYLAYPRVMGHEVSATVLSAGAGVSAKPGTRVVVDPYLACGRCNACARDRRNCCETLEVLGVHRDGAMCERILVPEANLLPLPGVSMEQAAAVEFLAIGAHAVRRSQGPAGLRALVVGAGPIGLGTAIFARIAGQAVVVADRDRERLDFAESLGFAVEQVGSGGKSGGGSHDIVYDATGNAASIQAAFGRVAHGGVLVMVSVVAGDITFSDPEFHKREMMLIGSRNAQRRDFDHVARSLAGGAVPVDCLITHRTTLADAVADLPRWSQDKAGLIKAVIAIDA